MCIKKSRLSSIFVLICLALLLPFTYGGCNDGGGGGSQPTNPPTTAPTTPPTTAPTSPPTTAPTNPPTAAPTNPPTAAPTNPPSTGFPPIGPPGPPGPTPPPEEPDFIDSNDIGGTVSINGVPEAGVWVIAQTFEVHRNLGAPGQFHKIVVTDEDGRYVVPDLPPGTYDLWVRGYGLADSEPIQGQPGQIIDLEAVLASSPREAALVYPANYWFAMLDIPDDDELPGTGPDGNGWSPNLGSQAQFVNESKLGCQLCHQLGIADTRLPNGEAFDTGWLKASQMNSTANGLGRPAMIRIFGEWGEKIAAGAYPAQTPPRPSGRERNFVLTMWEWGDYYTYAHDETSSDKRNPTLYPYGNVYGVDIGQDYILELDPINHVATRYKVPTRGGYNTAWTFGTLGRPAAGGTSAHLGVYHNPANPHNPMFDDTGKVWITTQLRAEGAANLPAYCRDPEIIPGAYAQFNGGHRQLGYFDTLTQEFVLIDTCYGTHHLHFDANGDLWTSGDSNVFGVLRVSELDPEDPEGTEAAAQEYWRVRIDTDGDGVADTNRNGFNYGVIPNLYDGTIWSAQPGYPGRIVRFDPSLADDPSDNTVKFETYTPPPPGNGGRGLDVDTEGNVWICLSGSSHVAKFERDKCAQTWGAGDQCPEGWTLWEIPGPVFEGTDKRSDNHYYTWVDQFNTGGLGENAVICTGTGSDSIITFLPDTEEFIRTYVPYPMGFYHRGQDGRIDDINAGWPGRGWWVDYGSDPLLHTEIEQGFIFQVQYRPTPLDTGIRPPEPTPAPTPTPTTPPGPTPRPTTPPGATIHTVSMQSPNVFVPKNITIKPGDTVRWVNNDFLTHDVRADGGSFSSAGQYPQFIPAGATYQHTFTNEGSFPYYCILHGTPGGIGMSGTVTVSP